MKKSEVRLTQLASAAGCGAKIGPKVLAQVVGKLPKFTDPMLLVGPETSDDAAVYKINDELEMCIRDRISIMKLRLSGQVTSW